MKGFVKMGKHTYDMVQRFIDLGMNRITIKWNEIDVSWRLLVHERIISAGYVIEEENEKCRVYKIQIES